MTHLVHEERGTRVEVSVATVDSFQGSERDVVVVSCVRAGTQGVGFLEDERRLNVALTRAKCVCAVFGHVSTLEREATLGSMVADARRRGVLFAEREL